MEFDVDKRWVVSWKVDEVLVILDSSGNSLQSWFYFD